MSFKPLPVIITPDGHTIAGPVPQDYQTIDLPDLRIINGEDELVDFGNDYIPGMKFHLKEKQPRRKNTIKTKYKKRNKR